MFINNFWALKHCHLKLGCHVGLYCVNYFGCRLIMDNCFAEKVLEP